MKDVARAAGVSLKTVSRVVNHEPGVGEDTATRVLEAVARLGFRRNDMARTLRQGASTASIGLVIEDISDPFSSHLTRAVEEVASDRGYLVLVGTSEDAPERERELVGAFCDRRVDGLVVVPSARDHRYVVPEIRMGTAVVFVDRPPGRVEADTVLSDNAGGVRTGMRHLLAHGHRRIGWVGVEHTIWTGAERFHGYREALEAHGIPYDEGIVRLGPSDVAAAERHAHELLALPEPPTAIFTSNNRMTVGVLRACRAHPGVRHPALVGFDDFELSDVVDPPVTVVAQDPPTLGRRATELLFARLAGDGSPPRRVTLPTRLVVRGTSRPSSHLRTRP